MEWISPDNTICQALREIYHSTDNPKARLRCREATAMAKAMSAKLEEYQRNWSSGFWDTNPHFRQVAGDKAADRKPIDVLFLAYDDNANTGYRFWQCARFLGLNAVMFKGKAHPFGYPQQAPVHPSLANRPLYDYPTTVMAPGLESLMASAHVIHLLASTYPLARINYRGRHVVAQHGGSVYRQNPEGCNEIFNQIATRTIIQCPDLLGLGANNEALIYYPVDTDRLQPDFSRKGDGRIVVGHFPSSPSVKGTETITAVVENLVAKGLPIRWAGSTRLVSWPDNIKRMAACDVIVEGCNAAQGDKVYGEWGNTALEASALGCAVVTHCLHEDVYRGEYGVDLGLTVANDPAALEGKLRRIALMPEDKLTKLKKSGRKWVEDTHSIPATARRLWDLVYKGLFR
jgi:hypothetical protein